MRWDLADGIGGLDAAHEHVGEARSPLHPEGRMHLWQAEVRIEQDHPAAARGERQREVHRGERLALAAIRGRDEDDARGLARARST